MLDRVYWIEKEKKCMGLVYYKSADSLTILLYYYYSQVGPLGVKVSFYRFLQKDPSITTHYKNTWYYN